MSKDQLRRRYEQRELQEGYVRARLHLVAEGGRKNAITHDYRCDWDIGNVGDDGELTINGGPVTLEGTDELPPGEECLVRIHPIAWEFWSQVVPGMTIKAHEGPRVVGIAEVVELVPPLDRRPAVTDPD